MIATPISPVSKEHFTASAFPINGDWFSSMLDGGDASYGLTTDPTVIDFNPTLFSIDDPSLSDSGGTSTTFFTNFGSENNLSNFVGPLQVGVQPCSPLFAQDFSLGHPSATSLPNGSPYLPINVRFLLSHYANHVISSLSLQPHDTPPWRGIHLPCALTAYGELDVVGYSSFARVSLLYSLLSLTCYHLSSLYDAASPGSSSHITTLGLADQSPNVEFWSSQGLKFRNIARTAFHKCLGAMSSKPTEKVKYKELFASAMSLICTGASQLDNKNWISTWLTWF